MFDDLVCYYFKIEKKKNPKITVVFNIKRDMKEAASEFTSESFTRLFGYRSFYFKRHLKWSRDYNTT